MAEVSLETKMDTLLEIMQMNAVSKDSTSESTLSELDKITNDLSMAQDADGIERSARRLKAYFIGQAIKAKPEELPQIMASIKARVALIKHISSSIRYL